MRLSNSSLTEASWDQKSQKEARHSASHVVIPRAARAVPALSDERASARIYIGGCHESHSHTKPRCHRTYVLVNIPSARQQDLCRGSRYLPNPGDFQKCLTIRQAMMNPAWGTSRSNRKIRNLDDLSTNFLRRDGRLIDRNRRNEIFEQFLSG
jgi:hypothetical protein